MNEAIFIGILASAGILFAFASAVLVRNELVFRFRMRVIHTVYAEPDWRSARATSPIVLHSYNEMLFKFWRRLTWENWS